MKFRSTRISGPAALLILVAFFMPWITVSCGGFSQTVSGYELAAGTDTTEQAAEDEASGDVIMWLVPISAILVLVVAWRREGGAMLDIGNAAWQYGIAGIMGLGAQIYKYLDVQSAMSDAEQEIGGVIQVTYEIGWWLCALALIGVLVAAYMSGSETEEGSSPPRAPNPPDSSFSPPRPPI